MWRKFLGIGIPILSLGFMFLVIGWAQLDSWYGGAGGGASALILIGEILAIVGGMLTNAGLIGAAVGADVRSLGQRVQMYQAQMAPPQPGAWSPPAWPAGVAPVSPAAPAAMPAALSTESGKPSGE